MRPIVFYVNLFDEDDRAWGNSILIALLNILIKINERHYQLNPGLPWLYQSGIRYDISQEIERGVEEWRDIVDLLKIGYGDCEDLACARVAELRIRQGINARIRISWRKVGNRYIYHVTVVWPDGRIEDPSRILGMTGTDGLNQRLFKSRDDRLLKSRLPRRIIR